MGVSPRPLELKVEVAQLSDPGRDPNKQINEDSCGYARTKFGHLCVLCDGMGGHYGGQEASRRAIKTIFEHIEQVPDDMSPIAALKQAIELAGRRVYELGGPPDNKVRPGSTVVAMLLHDAGCDVAHVGDSRAYIIRSGQIYPLTRDHSMVQAMIDAGFLNEEQAIGHPDANKITRALGMKPDVDVEVRPEPMELFAGDILLTTSDGLTDLALGKDILGATKQALASGGLEHACQQLVRMANDRGGHDNITVQLVRVAQTAPGKTRAGTTSAPAVKTVPEQPVPAAVASDPGMASPPTMSSLETVVQQRSQLETIPMQSATTAHDGTSRASHAAVGTGQTLPLPPNQGAPPMNQALAHSLDTPQPGLAGYRLDGVAGLHLPPPSTRYAGVTPTPAGVQPTPAMPAAHTQGYGMSPSFAGITSNVDSARGNGGNILFLVLAVSFVVAAVIMLIVWILFLR